MMPSPRAGVARVGLFRSVKSVLPCRRVLSPRGDCRQQRARTCRHRLAEPAPACLASDGHTGLKRMRPQSSLGIPASGLLNVLYHPPRAEFEATAATGHPSGRPLRLIPVYRELTSDTLTPLMAYRRLSDGAARSFLFESVVGGERVGRYSFIGAGPLVTLEATGHTITVLRDDASQSESVSDPLATLQQLLDEYPAVHLPGLPRFCGGAVGYAGYDVVRYTEHLPSAPPNDRGLPDLSFSIYQDMVIFDNIRKTVLVISHADLQTDAPSAAYDRAAQRIDDTVRRLTAVGAAVPAVDVPPRPQGLGEWSSNFTRAEFEQQVERCKEYIRAGDVFQVVVSQRFERTTPASAFDIYRALRIVNPSPFMFLVSIPAVTLVGSSPEIMVRVEDGTTTIRPLAGTRRRGHNDAEDQALAVELLADPKERAEHVMLVDLARNDVGRVSQYGSVRLSDVMMVEKYSHVMHITSNVDGQLRPGMTALDALRSCLPVGTVSGAPKVRAMQIIDEVEPHRRGPYAGAVGYLDFTGNMDTCIALRTLVLQGDRAYIQAGAGLVADSVPAAEFDETVNKARAMMTAVCMAETMSAPE